MTTLTCPKCRQGVPDSALDRGQCPACGFPLDGPLVLDHTGAKRSRGLVLAGAGVLVAGSGVVGYFLYPRTKEPVPEVATASIPERTAGPVLPVAPVPHEPKPPAPNPPESKPPVPVIEPKKGEPRPIGVVMKVDPKIAPKRHFDNPDDTAALPDLNSGDKVTLTGKVRVLRVGSVSGKGSIDASGLVAEEIVVTGDFNSEAVVVLHAPGGKVTLGGFVGGASRLTVVAPGGEVVLLANSGRLTGSAVATVTAKRIDCAGKLLGGARLNATLSAGGFLKLTSVEEGATVTYKRSAPGDPAPTVEKGVIGGGAKVLTEM